MDLTSLLSRKFMLALLIIALAGTAMLMQVIDWPSFMDAVKWIFGIYVVGNVGGEAVTALIKPPEPPKQ